MAFRDLWGAYAHACRRFHVDPGLRPQGVPASFSHAGSGANGTASFPKSPSLTRAFLEHTSASSADGRGWFAELGQQLRRDIEQRHGLILGATRTPEAEPDFESYFKNRKLRP